MRIRSLLPLSAALALTAFAPPPLGGWATITMDAYEKTVAVGEPLQLAFLVKQHGVRPMRGLEPRITASAKGQKDVVVKAAAAKAAGRYTASLQLPVAAAWSVEVHSGFGNSKITLDPIRVAAKDVAQAGGRARKGR